MNQTRTFALSGAEAAALLGRGGAMVDRSHLLIALRAWYLPMHLIGQIPQQTHTVLNQLHRDITNIIK